jgi:hypothetical protein
MPNFEDTESAAAAPRSFAASHTDAPTVIVVTDETSITVPQASNDYSSTSAAVPRLVVKRWRSESLQRYAKMLEAVLD